eukprot:SAG22_NODE_1684_length_3811_cov_1.797414_5_plen_82_part_00
MILGHTHDVVHTGVFITTTGEAPGTNRLEIVGTNGRLVAEVGGVPTPEDPSGAAPNTLRRLPVTLCATDRNLPPFATKSAS